MKKKNNIPISPAASSFKPEIASDSFVQVLYARDESIINLQESLSALTDQARKTYQGKKELGNHFWKSEQDREARGKVIEEQGKRIGVLEKEIDNRIKELKGLYGERDKLGQQLQALGQELGELKVHFANSEKDREARGKVIEEKEKQVGDLEKKLLFEKEEFKRTLQDLEKSNAVSQRLSAQIKIVLNVANPLVAFAARKLSQALEAELVKTKNLVSNSCKEKYFKR